MARRLRRVTRGSKPDKRAVKAPPVTRAQAAEDALASVRAEGLDPGRAEQLLSAWAANELTDEQLERARLQLLNDSSLTVDELLAGPRAA
jgi:hypothetical protein